MAGTRLLHLNTLEDSGFRFVAYAGGIIQLRHCGFLADDVSERIYRSLVVRTASPGGGVRYVAGYQISDTEAFVLDVGHIFQAPVIEDVKASFAARSAAGYADGLAEREAEMARKREAIRTRLPAGLREMRLRLAA